MAPREWRYSDLPRQHQVNVLVLSVFVLSFFLNFNYQYLDTCCFAFVGSIIKEIPLVFVVAVNVWRCERVVGVSLVGWNYYSSTNSFLYVSTAKEDQPSARTECQQMNADLASITDQQEMDFVISISSVSRDITHTHIHTNVGPHRDSMASNSVTIKQNEIHYIYC